MDNGGYYAIKGFAYQIDALILRLFEVEETEIVSIEQIQDINDKDYVIQVKHREATKFVPSEVKEPVIQLIDEFKKNKDREYHLYCHFGDENGYTSESVSIASILGNKIDSYDKTLLADFSTKFSLRFEANHQQHFEAVIQKLCEELGIGSFDEAVFCYSNIEYYLQRIVINNPEPENRNCCRKDVLDHVQKGENFVFSSAYEKYKGKQAYLAYMKSFCKLDGRDSNYFIFGEDLHESSSQSFSKVIDHLVHKVHGRKPTHDILPPTFIFPAEIAEILKKHLIENRTDYNDGYENVLFSEELFSRPSFDYRKAIGRNKLSETIENRSYWCRIISTESFKKIKSHPTNAKFFLFNMKEEFSLKPCVKAEGLESSDITTLFN